MHPVFCLLFHSSSSSYSSRLTGMPILLCLFAFHMQLVIPNVVAMAVRMEIIMLMIIFQVSFLLSCDMISNGFYRLMMVERSRLRRRVSRFCIGVVDVGLLRSGGC